MRIAFSTTPAIGHFLPMLPLLRAAHQAGHDVAVLTSGELAPFIEHEAGVPVTVLAAGLGPMALLEEATRRLGTNAATQPEPPIVAEFFGTVRVDTTIDEALPRAREWAPDVIVSETVDYVGPLVADVLGVPVFRHSFGPALPAFFTELLDAAGARSAAAHGLRLPAIAGWVDIVPPLLATPGVTLPEPRFALRPQAHRSGERHWTNPLTDGTDFRWDVLVTLGTIFTDPSVREGILESIDRRQANIVVTVGADPTAAMPKGDPNLVYVPFQPISDLLEGMNVVVTAGGAGTVLAALSAGVPMVVLPLGADQAMNAAAAAAAGAAVVVESASEVGAAVAKVAMSPEYARRAAAVAAEIQEMPSPESVLASLEAAVLAIAV